MPEVTTVNLVNPEVGRGRATTKVRPFRTPALEFVIVGLTNRDRFRATKPASTRTDALPRKSRDQLDSGFLPT